LATTPLSDVHSPQHESCPLGAQTGGSDNRLLHPGNQETIARTHLTTITDTRIEGLDSVQVSSFGQFDLFVWQTHHRLPIPDAQPNHHPNNSNSPIDPQKCERLIQLGHQLRVAALHVVAQDRIRA
jgi:hypothetical protein